MRVKIVGENDSAKAVRGYLRMAGVCVTDFLPPDAAYFIVYFEIGQQRNIICDSLPSELETNVLLILHELLQNLPQTPDVTLRRAGGEIHHDRELRLIVPNDDAEQQSIAERAAYLGILRTMHWGEKAAPEPRVPIRRKNLRERMRGAYRVLFPMLLFAALLHAQAPAGAGMKGNAAQSPLTVIPLSDSDKVIIRNLQHRQDKVLLQIGDVKLQLANLEKLSSDYDDQIQKAAGEIGVAQKIDLNRMVLDLDQLAWISKEGVK